MTKRDHPLVICFSAKLFLLLSSLLSHKAYSAAKTKRKQQTTDLDLFLLLVVCSSSLPMTYTDIKKGLNSFGRGYNTRTMYDCLDRLVKDGLLTFTRSSGRGYAKYYSPTIDAIKLLQNTEDRLKRLVESYLQGPE